MPPARPGRPASARGAMRGIRAGSGPGWLSGPRRRGRRRGCRGRWLSRRYGEPNGTTVAVQPIVTYGSRIAVTTCRPSSATANRDSVRCSSATTKRGQRAGAEFVRVAVPSTITTVNRTSSTRPLPRDTNQSPWDPAAAVALVTVAAAADSWPGSQARRRRRGQWPVPAAGPAAQEPDLPVVGDQPTRQTFGGQPRLGAAAGHDRRGGSGVGLGAGRRGHADRAPGTGRRAAGPRIHDVMHQPPIPAPLAAGHRGGRHGPQGQPDQAARCPGRPGPWFTGWAGGVGYGDRPAAGRRFCQGTSGLPCGRTADLLAGGQLMSVLAVG